MNVKIKTEYAQFPEKKYINVIFVTVQLRCAQPKCRHPTYASLGEKGEELNKTTAKRRGALQRYNTENSKQIFPGKQLRDHSPNFHIHVSVIYLYIPMIDLPILLQENMWTISGNIYKSLTDT
jgi:hypothetical protein